MIKRKKRKCLGCENDDFIFSWGKCKKCYDKEHKKPLKSKKKAILKISERGKVKKQEKKEYTEKQFELFREIYSEHPTKRCYECNKLVNGESSAQFHHLIFKSSRPDLALVKENICLICENCHSQVHLDSSKTPKLQQLTERIKEKYANR